MPKSQLIQWKFLEWRYLPLLLVMALSAGITVGFFSYQPSDTKVQLAPELCAALDSNGAKSTPISDSAPLSRSPNPDGAATNSQVPDQASDLSSALPPVMQNSFQVAVVDPVGIRLKTIVNR